MMEMYTIKMQLKCNNVTTGNCKLQKNFINLFDPQRFMSGHVVGKIWQNYTTGSVKKRKKKQR